MNKSTIETENTIVIACGCDTNYAMSLSVTINSMLRHITKQSIVCLFVIGSGLTTVDKIRLTRAAKIENVSVTLNFVEAEQKEIGSLHTSGYLSAAAFLRLLLPDVIPSNIKRVIYLDSDLLVNRDITELWNMPMDNHSILAVQDFGIQIVSNPMGGFYNWREMGLDPNHPYFNSGLMVIDMDAWRIEHTTQLALDYLRRRGKDVLHFDQEALNVVLCRKWKKIDITWNSMPLIFTQSIHEMPQSQLKEEFVQRFEELSQRPAICHYGGLKPWTHGRRMPMQEDWHVALSKSGWFSPSEYESWRAKWTVKHIATGFARKVMQRN